MQWNANDKTFLITGGASGMGAAYAEAFLNNGAQRVAILDIAVEVGKATAERLNKSHPDKAVFISCDVSKEEDIAAAFAAALAQLKQIDVIINNAGIMVDAPNMWRTASDVNYQGFVSMSLKGIEHMRKDKGGAGGTIVNIASTVALSRTPPLPTNLQRFENSCATLQPMYIGETFLRKHRSPIFDNVSGTHGHSVAAKFSNKGIRY